jgi:YfiR/HmsC-like
MLLFCISGRGQSSRISEDQVKAAFLYNFAKFVQWPEDSFSSPDSPLRMCTFGGTSLGPALEELAQGKIVAGRRVQVQKPRSLQQARSCQVLFIGYQELPRLQEVLAAVRGASVLVVSESPGFAAHGAMIEFVRESDRLRFEINAKAARDARMNISAKLLSLAKNVIE